VEPKKGAPPGILYGSAGRLPAGRQVLGTAMKLALKGKQQHSKFRASDSHRGLTLWAAVFV
jgi:hypothetical protein